MDEDILAKINESIQEEMRAPLPPEATDPVAAAIAMSVRLGLVVVEADTDLGKEERSGSSEARTDREPPATPSASQDARGT